MKTSFLRKLAIASTLILLFASCKEKHGEFIVQGKISDADTAVLYLEKKTLTETLVIDSVKLDKSGEFKFTEPSPEYSEFYTLKLNGQTITLAVDSIETITVNAPKATFAWDYTVEGSSASSKIKEVALAQYNLSTSFKDLKAKYENKELSQDEYANQVLKAIGDYKSLAVSIILSDYQSMAAYYAIFQKVDDYLIFDPYSKEDIRMFQAIATIWDQFKSRSPRAAHLKNFTLGILAEMRKEDALSKLGETNTTDAKSYYEISLPDMHNNKVNLSSLSGKVVILDFTAYGTNYSPAHNILINKVYSKHKGVVEVYQVSFDSDAHVWKNTATNLPWICVRDERSLNSNLLAKFNIQGLPTTYILDRNGDIASRVLSSEDLEATVLKIL